MSTKSSQVPQLSGSFLRCPNSPGVIYGRYHSFESEDAGFKAIPLPCDSWSCPFCREQKARAIMARSLRGGIVAAAYRAGFRESYNFKLLTLSLPGREFRAKTDNELTQGTVRYPYDRAKYGKRAGELRPAYTGSYTPVDAAKFLSDNFTGLRKWIRGAIGSDYHYLRVMESHKDGYPHLHVLLVGDCIAPASILGLIQGWWHEHTGGGVHLKVLENKGIVDAVKYVLKYLFKEPENFGARRRLFTASAAAILPPALAAIKYDWHKIEFTRRNCCRSREYAYYLSDLINEFQEKSNWIDAAEVDDIVFMDRLFREVAQINNEPFEALWGGRSCAIPEK